MSEIEIKPIEGHRGYFISKEGTAFSLKSGFLKEIRLRKNSRSGYLELNLGEKVRPGKYKTKSLRVHRLVAKAFLPTVEGKNVVNHIDGNRENNHVLNLEWCTTKENIHHSMHVLKTITSETHALKLTPEKVRLIRASNKLHREIAEEFGVSRVTVTEIKVGRTWKNVV